MKKTMIAPIVALLALVVKIVFGINVPDEIQEQIIQGISVLVLAGVTIHGIYKNHHDKEEDEK